MLSFEATYCCCRYTCKPGVLSRLSCECYLSKQLTAVAGILVNQEFSLDSPVNFIFQSNFNCSCRYTCKPGVLSRLQWILSFKATYCCCRYTCKPGGLSRLQWMLSFKATYCCFRYTCKPGVLSRLSCECYLSKQLTAVAGILVNQEFSLDSPVNFIFQSNFNCSCRYTCKPGVLSRLQWILSFKATYCCCRYTCKPGGLSRLQWMLSFKATLTTVAGILVNHDFSLLNVCFQSNHREMISSSGI